MASCREIVSLQLGNYSNYIGSHWWNIQESSFVYDSDKPSEINHDVLFREGLTPNREVTYTPRLLLVDLKGSLGHMPERGELYGDAATPSSETMPWPRDRLEVLAAPRSEKNTFLQDVDQEHAMQQDDVNNTLKVYRLEGVVENWTDYLRPRLHPRTVTVVKGYDNGGTERPFDLHQCGGELWGTPHFQEEFADRIRLLVEECDNSQGFHMLLDSVDGFGGLGAGVLSHLQDEYPRKDVLVFPCLPAAQQADAARDGVRTLNTALCVRELAEHASLFAPLCLGRDGWRQPGPPRAFPHIKYDESLWYHTGALLATALDTVSLRYRLRGDTPSTLGEMCGELGRLGRRAAAASLGLPFPLRPDAFLLDALEAWEGPLWTCVSPGCSLDADRIWLQSVTLRGVAPNRLKSPEVPQRSGNPAHACSSVRDMFSLFLSCCCYATLSHVTAANSACRVTAPFPNFFDNDVQVDGSVTDIKRFPDMSVFSVPVVAGLHSSSSVGNMLETLHHEASRVHPTTTHQFTTAGLEKDELREALDQILQLRECYHTQFDV